MNSQMRRNLLLLASCQALGQAANTMMFAATALSVATAAVLVAPLRHTPVRRIDSALTFDVMNEMMKTSITALRPCCAGFVDRAVP